MAGTLYDIGNKNIYLRRIIFFLAVAGLFHNIIGFFKGHLGGGPPSYWSIFFWLPPVVVSVAMYAIGILLIKRYPGRKGLVMIVWWIGIFLIVALDQLLPQWPHLGQSISLSMLGLAGWAGWITHWGIEGRAPLHHSKYTIPVLSFFGVAVAGVFLLIVFIWFVPESSLLKLSTRHEYMLFRSLSSVEVIGASFIFFTVAVREILAPLLRTYNIVRKTTDPSDRAKNIAYADVFICHASEDKGAFVRKLADGLRKAGLYVWYDEFSLSVGDSLRRSIDDGLKTARYGIVIMSHAFFSKSWPQYELDGLVTRHLTEHQLILPIWHGVDKTDVITYSPPLANIVALRSSLPLEEIIASIVKKVRR